ncbi:RHS repeat-associated core domain-containing protein, partial [Kitasatospora sp. NPDC058263]
PGALGSGGDSAVTFNGCSTSWIELPNRAVSASVNRSLELWFRTDSAGVILSLQNRAMGEDPYNVVTTRNAAKFTYDGGSNNLTGDGTWSYARDAAGTLLGATNGTANLRIRTDQHTDATATLNTDGTTVTGATTYDPFGKPVATTGTRSSLGYQSGWTDRDSGDVNMAARWYRPGTGSFTSRDSWQLDPSPSTQANRYTYANADPLNRTDPTGHFAPAPAPVKPVPLPPRPNPPAPKGGGGGRTPWGLLATIFTNILTTNMQDDSCEAQLGMSCAEYNNQQRLQPGPSNPTLNPYYGYVHQGSGLGALMATPTPQITPTPVGAPEPTGTP